MVMAVTLEAAEVWMLELIDTDGAVAYATYPRARDHTLSFLRDLLNLYDVYSRVELVNTSTGEREVVWASKGSMVPA